MLNNYLLKYNNGFALLNIVTVVLLIFLQFMTIFPTNYFLLIKLYSVLKICQYLKIKNFKKIDCFVIQSRTLVLFSMT